MPGFIVYSASCVVGSVLDGPCGPRPVVALVPSQDRQHCCVRTTYQQLRTLFLRFRLC